MYCVEKKIFKASAFRKSLDERRPSCYVMFRMYMQKVRYIEIRRNKINRGGSKKEINKINCSELSI